MAIPLGKNRQFVILDHGIGEQVVGDLVELCLAGPIHLDLNRLADADGKNSLEAQMLHGAASGDTGRIENGGFGHDGDNSFHEDWKIGRAREMDKGKMPKRMKISRRDAKAQRVSLEKFLISPQRWNKGKSKASPSPPRCLDSNSQAEKLADVPANTDTTLCLDSNSQAEKLGACLLANFPVLCLDSNSQAEKLLDADGRWDNKLCLDSNSQAEKLFSTFLVDGSLLCLDSNSQAEKLFMI